MPYNTTAIPPRKEATGQTQLPRKFHESSHARVIRHSCSHAASVTRVKKIVNLDKDISMCSNNAAFVITLATVRKIAHSCVRSRPACMTLRHHPPPFGTS